MKIQKKIYIFFFGRGCVGLREGVGGGGGSGWM